MRSKFAVLIIIILAATATFSQAAKPPSPAKLPTAQEIISKYVKAIGGREANEKVKAWTVKGTVEMAPMGIKGTFEQITAAPDRSLMKMSLAGLGDFLEGFDGTTAWSVNPIQGRREKTGIELLQTKLTSDFYRSVKLEKLYSKLEVKGIEKVGDKDAYVVVAQTEGLPASTMYFDVNSGMMLRTDTTVVSPEGQQPVKVFIDEMKQFEGVMVPTKMRTVVTSAEIILNVTDVKSEPSIDDAKFAKPKA